MKKVHKLSICLFVMFIAGCMQPTVRPHIQNSQLFDAPYDETWNAVVEVFANSSYPIKAIEKESGFISTDWKALPDANFNRKEFSRPDANFTRQEFNRLALVPDKSLMMIWGNGRFTVNTLVKSKGDNMTEVRINTYIEAFEINMSMRYHECYSTGFIENMILRRIGTKIKSTRLNL